MGNSSPKENRGVFHYGFDVGGTKIAAGVYDSNYQLQYEKTVPTPKEDYDKLVLTITDLVHEFDKKFHTQGTIGIGIPGMETKNGTVLCANIPGVAGKFLRADLEKGIKRNIQIENDANCFALAEAWRFPSAGSCIGVIIGTGVGGGLVINGKLFTGANKATGEFGHVRITADMVELLGPNPPMFKCGCVDGACGCVDKYLSGSGFERLYEHRTKKKLGAVEIIKLAESGDIDASQHCDLMLDLMSIFLVNLCHTFDPEVIVLGGGLSNWEAIYSEVPGRMRSKLMSFVEVPRIVKATIDCAGREGAARLCTGAPAIVRAKL